MQAAKAAIKHTYAYTCRHKHLPLHPDTLCKLVRASFQQLSSCGHIFGRSTFSVCILCRCSHSSANPLLLLSDFSAASLCSPLPAAAIDTFAAPRVSRYLVAAAAFLLESLLYWSIVTVRRSQHAYMYVADIRIHGTHIFCICMHRLQRLVVRG